MRFLYMIQGKSSNVVKYLHLNAGASQLQGLTYDQSLAGFDFLPKSSFAQGRNHLYRLALQRLPEFDYFVFLDDDVEFCRGSFEQMERNLSRFRPSVGVPLTEKTRRSAIGIEWGKRIQPVVRCQRFHVNDEQYIAFRRDVIEEGKVLPYLETWDTQSWFVTCLIQEALIQIFYHKDARQFNDCEIVNNQHSGDYPHNLDFARQAYLNYMEEYYSQESVRPADFRPLLTIESSPAKMVGNLLGTASALVRRTSLYRRLRNGLRTR